MRRLGLSTEIIRELHTAAHFYNLDTFVDRLETQNRDDDLEEEA
jgi:hypothetical protein